MFTGALPFHMPIVMVGALDGRSRGGGDMRAKCLAE
ncbi:hypothetical protein SUDANB19_00359 [Streptomyces sp. enrichment culture]